MSTAMLLVYPSDPGAQRLYNFDHSHEHAKLVNGMKGPIRYNLPQYLLDPPHRQDVQAGGWQTRHQIAHDDAADYYSVHPSLIFAGNPRPEAGPTPWTQFSNHQEHVALNRAAGIRG